MSAAAPVRVVYLPSPFPRERRIVDVEAGPSLEEIAAATKAPPAELSIALDQRVVPPERWSATRPAAGGHVVVVRRPGGVDPLSLVAIASLSAQASSVLPGALASMALTAAAAATSIAFWGSLAYGIGKLTAAFVEVPRFGSESGPGVRQTVAGDRNYLPRYEPVPQVLGRHKLVPPSAAATYTLLEDGKLVQYSLYTFGPGPLELSELKLGEDPIFKSSTTIVYTGQMEADGVVEKTTLELRQGGGSDAEITLYSKDVQEAVFNERLRFDREVTHRTVSNTRRIVLIVGFPEGLVWIDHHGKWKDRTVRIDVDYRAVGASAWTDAGQFTVTDKTRDSLYVKRAIDVTEGTYDVRLRRITEEGGHLGISDLSQWTLMHQHRAGVVVRQTGLCQVAMRRQLTNNGNGISDQLSGVAQTVCLDWNGSTWVTRATSNPASLYRHVLQGASNLRPVADARIDLTALAAWHEQCDSEGFEFNWVTQGRSTVWETLRKIAAAGRATAAVQDGLFTVVRDTALSGGPVEHFTPRNVISFTGRRVYDRKPHGLKVPFVNPDEDWLDTEDIAYDDGFEEDNATEFERLEIAGITDWDQAWKLARYHIAALRLRPEEFVIETTLESLNVVRGDWVKFAHDACLIGLAYGRVVSVAVDGGGNATGVTVDQECPMAAASYGIRFRRASDSLSVHADVVTNAGNQTVLVFAVAIAAASKPAVGDVFSFGEIGEEMIDCRVKGIEPGDDHSARLVLVDAAAAALDAADGTIPAYKSHVTIPPATAPSKKLPKVRVNSVESVTVRSQEQRTASSAGLRLRLGLPPLEVRK